MSYSCAPPHTHSFRSVGIIHWSISLYAHHLRVVVVGWCVVLQLWCMISPLRLTSENFNAALSISQYGLYNAALLPLAHKSSTFTEPEKLCAKSGEYTFTGQNTPPHTAGHLRSNVGPTHILAGSSKSVWPGASSESRLEPEALAPFETRRARPRIMTGC